MGDQKKSRKQGRNKIKCAAYRGRAEFRASLRRYKHFRRTKFRDVVAARDVIASGNVYGEKMMRRLLGAFDATVAAAKSLLADREAKQ